MSSEKPRKRGRPRKPETRAEINIDWCQRHLLVPEGKFAGKPLRLAEFMKDDFKAIYDNPAGTRRAIITRGRKNGKTIEAAMIVLLHLCGPESKAIPNGQLYSTALSRDQAGVLFALAAKLVRMSPTLNGRVHIKDHAKTLVFPGMATTYRALSAEAATAYGLSPSLVVHDELGQTRGPRSPLYEAMETATAAQENPLSIIISTQAPTDNDLLSVLIDDARGQHDKKTILRIDAANVGLDPFSLEAIELANPAFHSFMNKAEVLAMAESARRMPSRQAEYENLILNRKVETANPLFSAAVWKACGGEPIGDFTGKPVYAGLDLSSTNDLTALVLVAWHEVKWHVRSTFWLPEDGLLERARHDRVPYDVWAKKCTACVLDNVSVCLHAEKVLATTPGASIEYEFVAEHLRGLFDRYDMRQVAFDRWNWRHLKPWLEKAGFSEAELERFVEFGQGFQSMSPALRDLESVVLGGKMAHGNQPALQMCAANAVVVTDPAGNRKLDKKKARGRIDGIVALAMAVAVAATEEIAPPKSYQFFVIGGKKGPIP